MQTRMFALIGFLVLACTEVRTPVGGTVPSEPRGTLPSTDGGPSDVEAVDGDVVDAQPLHTDSGAWDAASEVLDSETTSGPDAGVTPAADAAAGPERGAPPAGADLAVDWASPPPSTTSPGAVLQLGVLASNWGGRQAPGSAVEVSMRGAAAGSEISLATVVVRTLAGGDSERLSIAVVLPPSLMPGVYYLRAQIDPASLVPEADETNNASGDHACAVLTVRVSPASVSFGTVGIGCSPADAVFQVEAGAAPALLTAATLTASSEFNISTLSLPQVITAGAALAIHVRYAAADVGADSAGLSLTVSQNGAQSMVSVALAGVGSQPTTLTESFMQGAGVPVADVLFIVDNSCSMTEEQNGLAGQFAAFDAYAQSIGLDYRIAVTTTDVEPGGARGAFVGSPRVISSAQVDRAQAFRLRVQVGTNGSPTESGLAASVLALTPPLTTTVNSGFLRQDASLVVIYLSDEEDYSSSSVATYVQALRAAKPGGSVRLNAIVGTAAGGCSGAGGAAEQGTRYMQAVATTGGTATSICDSDWSAALTGFAGRSRLQASFSISQIARAGSLSVEVNGVTVSSSDWTYDGARTITFAARAVPATASRVTISYSPRC